MLKKWFKSKTVIFNVLTLVVAIAMALSEMELSPMLMQVIGMVIAIGNIFLRFLVNKPLYTKKRRKKADNKPIPGDAKEYVEGYK